MEHKYGADLNGKQFILLSIALCTGTLIEWYDFTIYSQLSSTITEVFFPPSNDAAQQLSYWAVFALGFVARPLGSILWVQSHQPLLRHSSSSSWTPSSSSSRSSSFTRDKMRTSSQR
eukprot:GHRQ01020763.1.p1 GENE.GHRQ01020763.1~~GHRQ01020763.1.p1  ORF type:complete len:117 (+),score=27.45 GHRQ01020763.1:278-628(+)